MKLWQVSEIEHSSGVVTAVQVRGDRRLGLGMLEQMGPEGGHLKGAHVVSDIQWAQYVTVEFT